MILGRPLFYLDKIKHLKLVITVVPSEDGYGKLKCDFYDGDNIVDTMYADTLSELQDSIAIQYR
jgi:hypothetical protein